MQQIGTSARVTSSATNADRSSTRQPLRHTSRRKRSARTPSRSIVWKVVAAVAGLAALTSAAVMLELDARRNARSGGPGTLEKLLTAAGFGIDEVVVTGHRVTLATEIFDAIDLPNVMTMPALEVGAVKARIERLPWIDTANLIRAYPGRLEVVVTERTPFAVWTHGAITKLIDAGGRELSAGSPSQYHGLPKLAGDGAPQAASALFAMLTYYPAIQSRLQLATRLTQRRWQLLLDRGVRLELPSQGEATALAALLADPAGANLLERPDTIIDLRSHSQIAVRPVGGS